LKSDLSLFLYKCAIDIDGILPPLNDNRQLPNENPDEGNGFFFRKSIFLNFIYSSEQTAKTYRSCNRPNAVIL
jgi:hypothetical protein